MYAFVLSIFLIVIHFAYYDLKVNKKDILFLLYVTSALLVLFANNIYDRQVIFYVLLPLTFYYLGRSISLVSGKSNVLNFLLLLFVIFSILKFFTDMEGNFSFNLASNVHFLTRTGFSSNLMGQGYMNAIHVSLWVSSSILIALSLYLKSEKYVYIYLILFLLLLLTVLGSRTSFISVILILVINLYIFYGFKNPIRFFAVVTLVFAFLIIMAAYIPYFTVVFNRVQQLSLESGASQAFGLNIRYESHWLVAYKVFLNDIWGRGYLFFFELHYGRSTHNEFLGQLIAVGLLPTIIYFLFIAFRLKNLIRSFKRRFINVKELVAMNFILLYLANGITEQIFLGNTLWMSYFFFVIGISTDKKIHYDEN